MSRSWPPVLDAFQQTHQPEILDQLTLVSPKELGRNYLLHMSKNDSLPELTPYVCTRTKRGEDRTVARACMSGTLAACVMGYGTTLADYLQELDSSDGFGKKEVKWRGGWYLYAAPFRYAFRPSPKLVGVEGDTDEHWLVTFDEGSRKYPTLPVGKFFYRTVHYRPVGGVQTITVELIVEVTASVGVWFSEGVHLAQGYWQVVSSNLCTAKDWRTVKAETVKRLSRAEYDSWKAPVADLLHMREPSPVAAW